MMMISHEVILLRQLAVVSKLKWHIGEGCGCHRRNCGGGVVVVSRTRNEWAWMCVLAFISSHHHTWVCKRSLNSFLHIT
uniref:Uncharacterized protein n=1 Tax=Cannabis sativa TaxID=3483 RepID=A0A803R9D4_CANSA